MSKKVLFLFGAALALLTLLCLFFFQSKPEEESDQVYQSSDWQTAYEIDSRAPRGLSIFNELLEYRGKHTSFRIEENIGSKDLNDCTTYVFVGDKFQLKEEEFERLLLQVQEGANLFLAYEGISAYMQDYFFEETKFHWDFSRHLDLRFGPNQTALRLSAVHQEDTIAKTWHFFNLESPKQSYYGGLNYIKTLSSVNGNSNMVEFELGSGHIYLHSNPELFQNYQQLSENGYSYGQYMLGFVPENHQVCWLELGRLDDKYDSSGEEETNGQKDDSYLQFLFKNKALTIALLLIILGLILYLLFRTKRSQPFVPYLPKSANHSLSFADTIKEIYFRTQTPYSILQVMRKNFFVAVNKQFFIDISKKENEIVLAALAEKSGVSLKRIKEIMAYFETQEPTQVDHAYLHKASVLQQQLYREMGIVKEKMQKRVDSKRLDIRRKIGLAISLLFGGLFSIFYGFYLLFIAQSIGILLWPMGIVMLAFGVRLLLLPIMRIEGEQLVFYSLFATKKAYHLADLVQLQINQGVSTFEMSDQRKFKIVHAAISQYDLLLYEQFVKPYLKEEL